MKKTIFIVLFQMAFILINSYAQNNKKHSLYLTNYTFSDTQNEVGHVKINQLANTQIKSVKIEGEQAGSIRVDKDYKLSVIKDKLKKDIKWLDFIVNVKTSNGSHKETFRIVRDEFIRNKVIAHRGAWKNTGATENAALDHAIKMGCEGSEFDVHMSSDSIPFINHDPHIQGVSIAKTPSDQVSIIKLSNGETLPTLEAYIKAGLGQNKTKLILEIKASELGKESSLALTRKVVVQVEKLNAQAWVDYISFDYDVCKEVMKLAPYAKVAYLMGDKTPQELAQENFYGLDYHFSVLQKNPTWIKEAQQSKITINVWTVNDKAVMENLLKDNVDFITTNEPEVLLDLVKSR